MSRSSASFDLLDERVRRWIWRQGWTSLKDIQENAIPVVLAGNSDVIISASTAGGKTEAAFLPILTSILQNGKSCGYQVLYVSPLKALINDQYRRLSDMTSEMGIDVIPWHGDIDAARKTRSLKNPNGIVIITPESLESFLINRERFVKGAFSSLQYVVIDELHSFIGTERGKQLQSLLSRIEQVTRRHIPRIAMSATFSDYDAVKYFLRNDGLIPCAIPPQGESNHEIKILVKEYISSKDADISIPISQEIYNNLRGSNNLVFTNSRGAAEEFAVQLSDMCEENGVPNEFRVHHGSISKIERESVERDLQRGEHPVTALCTSTLELGVDIGKVKSIAQIGTAISVSGLRQRLGRSGRRDEPSILRVFSIERNNDGLLHDLRSSLVQNIAIIELMREHRYETPSINRYHFSTLIQQILAVIAQFGGFYPKDGWTLLCQNGAFKNVTPELFLELLKSLGEKEVISQLNTGQIVVGKLGERILKSPDFYVAFVSPIDLTVINKANAKRIGMIQYVPQVGKVIILSAKRWLVESFDEATSKVYVSRIKSGGAVMFAGEGVDIDRIIVEKMQKIYLADIIYPYLDERTGAKEHLNHSRIFFHHNNLGETSFLQYGNEDYFFNWAGTKANRTLALLAQYCLNKQCDYGSFYVSNLIAEDIELLRRANKPDLIELASILPRQLKTFQKYDYLLSDKLLNIEYANTYLDLWSD
ncbi:DEAD/DEAH box helicase [Alistipes communis]|uniref:DEAD/DEAH box helicase n=1 Tax=Alistipes communis TaxID=2585118 RepID=UPI003077F30C